MQKFYLLLLPIFIFVSSAKSQTLYFPPINNNLPWDTISPSSLGWCSNKIDSLYDFLQQENTKAFILLKDGKIVLEKYFGTFTKDSAWYWASAGKTLTAFMVGKAAENNLLKLSDSSSKYLGTGWSACTPAQENKITIRNHLTMTTGLDDGVPDNHCTIDTCLQYLAAPGTRWAYHNGPYNMLHDVLINATGQTVNNYMQQKLKTQTGITGSWFDSNYDHVYYSKARSMARFGLLAQNNFIWNTDTLLTDTVFKNQMINTSQNLNKSYGYLWWLNGKSSFMLPTLQNVFPGYLIPNAPADMIAALGKNSQLISISKSKGILFIRMGDAPNTPGGEVATVHCNQIWQRLNSIACNPLPIHLISFSAKKINQTALLEWVTTNDKTKSTFIIERSTNGIAFTTIGKMDSRESNDSKVTYSYMDNDELMNGSKLYYRLKVLNPDQTITYTKVVVVNWLKNNLVTIFPNPASKIIYVNGKAIKHIDLLDISGKVVVAKSINTGSFSVDISGLANGIYTVRITGTDGLPVYEKIIVQ